MTTTPLDRCVTSLDAISRELQAVYEFARGRCCACSGMTEDTYGQRNLYTERDALRERCGILNAGESSDGELRQERDTEKV